MTALCILENFGNYESLTMADRVLKIMGKQKAKESYMVSEYRIYYCIHFIVLLEFICFQCIHRNYVMIGA